jgi:hypothetical protein
MKTEYLGRSVLILEQDVDDPVGNRRDRWFDGFRKPGDIYLPLVMVNSGHRVSNGNEDFESYYRFMVNDALQRPANASMAVQAVHVGNELDIDVTLTNHSGTALSSANAARINVLVWEDPTTVSEVPVVRRAGSVRITDLADGDSGDFSLEVGTGGIAANRLRWVVIADYQPYGSNAPFDTLQAVTGP